MTGVSSQPAQAHQVQPPGQAGPQTPDLRQRAVEARLLRWRKSAAQARVETAASALVIVALGVLSLTSFAPHLSSYLPNFPIWILAIGYCVLLCWLISRFAYQWRGQLRALGAMWRPWAVVLLAGYFLFFVPQGRELGSSLMIGDSGSMLLWRAFFLLLVLVYWALNNWLGARRGIAGALESGAIGVKPRLPANSAYRLANPRRRVLTHQTPWVFWGPRLVGVCAHLAAAVSLGLAARRDFGDGWLGLLLALAAAAIICALTALVYRQDKKAYSQRDKGPRASPPPATSKGFRAEASHVGRAVMLAARKSNRFLLWSTFVLLAVATCAYFVIPRLAPAISGAFIAGTGAISISAVVYLTLISSAYFTAPLDLKAPAQVRQADDTAQAHDLRRWTIILVIPALALIPWTWVYAASLGRFFGSMVIVFFAFGALLAVLNFLEWGIESLAGAKRARWVRAYVTAGVIAFCVLNAKLVPFHQVRHLDAGRDIVDARPSVDVAAERWYDQAKAAYREAHSNKMIVDGDKAPMLIVATAGGGIRAAYWTAAVLDKVGKGKCGAGPYIFAISGVSGGSVGAAAFAASLKDLHESKPDADASNPGCEPGKFVENTAISYLADDYLAPALTSWLFKDTFLSLAWWSPEDRAVALEQGFEAASNQKLADSFLSLRKPPANVEAAKFWSPILLLNATHEQTGRRIIASQARVERQVFVDALDELDVLGYDLPASTAAVNSARFTYVSPAGDLGGDNGSLIDGGYYENFGALTGLEIAQAAEAHLQDYVKKGREQYKKLTGEQDADKINTEWPEVKLTVLMITSDPELGKTTGDRKLDGSQSLVRIDRVNRADAKEVCLANVTEHDPAHPDLKGPNYLPDIWKKQATSWPEFVEGGLSEVFGNGWVNEFVAPFKGLQAVREAHGNRAAAQLALQVCAEYRQSRQDAQTFTQGAFEGASNSTAPQTAIAVTSSNGKNVVATESEPAEASATLPYFAHVGMCKTDVKGAVDINPPLGWVLSKATRRGLDRLVCRCGNLEQLEKLEQATGAKFNLDKFCQSEPDFVKQAGR